MYEFWCVKFYVKNELFKLSLHTEWKKKNWTKTIVENATKLIKYTQHLNRDCSTRHLTKHSESTYIFSKGETINPFSQVLKLGVIPILFFLFLLKLRKQQRSIKSRRRKCLTINIPFPSGGLKKALKRHLSSLALANQSIHSCAKHFGSSSVREKNIHISLKNPLWNPKLRDLLCEQNQLLVMCTSYCTLLLSKIYFV